MGPDVNTTEEDKREHTLVEVSETIMKCFDPKKEEKQSPSLFLLLWEPDFWGEIIRKWVLSM